MVAVENLKEKFARLQEQNQFLRDKRISLETEIKTLDADYQKKLQELLELTGTSSYEEAVAFCQKKRKEIEEETERLDKELEQYLNPQAVNSNGTS